VLMDGGRNWWEQGRAMGGTQVIEAWDVRLAEKVMALMGGGGWDVVIEAVGPPAAFDTCQAVVAAGGVVANVGVHGKPVQLNLERLWAHNIALTTRLVDTVTAPMLLKLFLGGRP